MGKQGVTCSNKVAIHFLMTNKVEGELPLISDLTEAEKADFRSICKFYLDFDVEALGSEFEELKIVDCEIVYDGVSPSPSSKQGFFLDEDEDVPSGHPSPIIIFSLNLQVDPEEFKRAIWMSWVRILSENMDEDEPFITEDQYGYTDVISESQLAKLKKRLKSDGCYSGKHYSKEQLSKGVLCSDMLHPT